ncbi:alpha/beta hydrolase [Ancylobacter sp. WKF20]|uniref:alpha/beta hydrolase n=1 Tax=Ancylobacter sp. WKF20 TaxID=3039801 RepID=UPI00243437DC|nr:alpha/beta hydrolase [Ancylobacter sp. WKF20]WGD30211.1 alpha/beta hydrolase [Ancylobacter sp. WKF20]
METHWQERTLDCGGTPRQVRVYAPASPASAPNRPKTSPAIVLHLHGGTFTCGDLDCSVAICRSLAAAGATVVSLDYPLAPEHPFPAALNVSYAALELLHRQRTTWAGRGARLFVAGEEAGANIATALTLMARDQHHPPIAGQILISPMLDPCLGTGSVRAAGVGEAGCRWADGWHLYLGSADKAAHPYAAPLGSRRLGGIPPALIVTSDTCPMRDESVAYGRRLTECGVQVEAHVVREEGDPVLPGTELPLWAHNLTSLFTAFLAGGCVPAAATIQA